MKIKANITKKMVKDIGNYSFEVGVLQNEPKKTRKKGSSKSFAGLKVSASGKVSPKVSLAEVAKYTDNKFKWLKKPFKLANNKDVINVVKELSKQVFGKKSIDNKRLENAVQAVIRNPILRGDYGNNAASTIKAKGFNKLGIDTAQLFKSIKAKRL
jgi:Tfp pilus assembly major pilin PilA